MSMSDTPRRRRRPTSDAPARRADPTSPNPPSPNPASLNPTSLNPTSLNPTSPTAGPAGAADTGTTAAAARSSAPIGTSFSSLGVPDRLVAVLEGQGIAAPFPIQVATLPDTLAGRDVLGRGRTGSGKTLAFSLPMVARLAGGNRRNRQARALVLVPTRELANQVLAVVEPLAAAVGLTSTVVFGGVGQNPQVRALSRGVDVLIACPGRLEDLIGQGFCDLSAVEITVLDEADHMADLGFLPGVKRILDRTPAGGQRMLFSATLDNGVDVLVKRYLDRPTTHSVDPAVAPVSTMTHHVFAVRAVDKPAVVAELASGQERSLLFMRTKHTAKKLAKQLTAAGIPAVELHGNLSQGARERNLSAFTDGTTRVLVATDIAARGIHVDDVALVVHVDPPTEHKAYLHRSGRTARAGAGGTVVTLALPEQARDVRTLAKQAGIRPVTVEVRPGASEILALTGPPAPYVEPVAVVDQPSRPPRQTRPATGPGGPRTGGARTGGARTGGGRSGGAGTGRGAGSRTGEPTGAGSAAAHTGGGGHGGGAAHGPTRAPGTGAGSAKRNNRKGASAPGPARTRAELAARAGQQPPASRRRSF
jgi:superfamily II DNA/RNA helicase